MAVAPSVLGLLLTFPEEIVPQVQDVLSSDDNSWKWFVLHFLVIELPQFIFVLYRSMYAERGGYNYGMPSWY
ncbi:DUF5071 domain-containing protein [Lysinibacillus sphaericus]|uniref:DUF5071 domain-containing protein n=1 Tax=Lysinibacillus sphaericus TaxID=1421 RepID=UPI00296E600B